MEGKKTIYCMMRLDPDNPIIYCADGTKLPPMRVTESFLSTQPQFCCLSELIEFLTTVCQLGTQEIVNRNQVLLISKAKVSEIYFNLSEFLTTKVEKFEKHE